MKHKNFVIITSINSPNEVINQWNNLKDVQLIVIGDKKSPTEWNVDGVKYFGVQDQNNLKYSIMDNLPYNHYCRKMLGYLIAIENGADYIVDTDDDNFPKKNWNLLDFTGNFDTINENSDFVNIYRYFTNKFIWPRGFPLDLIKDSMNIQYTDNLKKINHKIGIWQGLADDDSDVDAIYRLVLGDEVKFNNRSPIVLDKFSVTPFNSQNTIFRKELFKLLYLPTFVSFRFTDILRGIIAQPIMWCYDYKLGFTNATVYQERNDHDFMKDFESEVPMYINVKLIYSEICKIVSKDNSIDENLLNVYKKLVDMNITESRELIVLKNWLDDVNTLNIKH